MSNQIKVIAHSSSFHTDDIFAVATILLVLGEEADVSVIRTRDMAIIETGDYVVDIGGVHDESTNRFDHHQFGGAGKRENGIPYASFGLVWKKFGKDLVGSEEGARRIDKIIVQPVDAGDNGVQFIDSKIDGLIPFDIVSIIKCFSSTWKEKNNIDEKFMEFVSYAKILMARLIVSVKDGMEAEQFVLDSYNSATDKRLIEVDESYPWMSVLSKFPEPLFVFYKNRDNQWTIKNVRSDEMSFESRKKLPESWAGKRDEELEKVTGVPGSVFCHNGRFMAVAKTREGVLQMAEIALNE